MIRSGKPGLGGLSEIVGALRDWQDDRTRDWRSRQQLNTTRSWRDGWLPMSWLPSAAFCRGAMHLSKRDLANYSAVCCLRMGGRLTSRGRHFSATSRKRCRNAACGSR